jgi:serine/threonine protein kinase
MLKKSIQVGKYILSEVIGKGSFSLVYKATNKETNEILAIKVVSLKNLPKKVIDNIENEINIMIKIKHDNIVRLYETIKTNNHICLVMDYCKEDLNKYIKHCGRISEKQTKNFITQISCGLHFLNKLNLIHRDLKPHNILICESGTVKIADFGFVKEYDANNMLDTLCGSPIYMAPEILQHKKYDAKVDLWSLGVILFEMLTNEQPFKASNHIELLKIIETTTFKIEKHIIISKDCHDLLKSLLVVEPRKRISFQDFFKHPFFNNYVFEEETEEDIKKSTFIDFIDEHFNVKEKDEKEILSEDIVDNLNLRIYIEYIYRCASEVASIGKIKEEKHIYDEALCLYNKTLKLLQIAIKLCEDVKESYDVFKELHSHLKIKFTNFLNKSDHIYTIIKLKYNHDFKIACAEKIIYYRALELCRIGASNEILNDITNAKILYIWAYRLFQSLLFDDKPLSQYDEKIINEYMIKIKERIDTCE